MGSRTTRNTSNDRVRRAALWHPFRVRVNFVDTRPGVSLRSTPGYGLTSLRDELAFLIDTG